METICETTSCNSQVREVICTDALKWLNDLADEGMPPNSGVFTSLPDITELSNLFSFYDVNSYSNWFKDTVALILSKLPLNSFAIFLQSDVRVRDQNGDVLQWIDKSHLCTTAADRAGCMLMWHKIAMLSDTSKKSFGRPNYSHLLCFAKLHAEQDNNSNIKASAHGCAYPSANFGTPDIFPRGEMLWPKAIGLNCAMMGVAFLKEIGRVSLVIDPFCGQGTVLAAANVVGISALGVELSPKRCRKARTLDLSSWFSTLSNSHKGMLGLVQERGRHDRRAAAANDAIDSVSACGQDCQRAPSHHSHPTHTKDTATTDDDDKEVEVDVNALKMDSCCCDSSSDENDDNDEHNKPAK